VEVRPRALDAIQPLYEPLAAATSRLHGRYGDAELAVIVDYLTQALEISAEHVNWLGTQAQVRPARIRKRY
jgi:hypothetical protein